MIILKHIRCPNCNRINGAMSSDTKGIQQFICKDSRCRYEFYVVDGIVDEKFDKSVVKII